MLTVAIFTIARTENQPRCPSADDWIKKLWYIYTVEYYSAIKSNTFEFSCEVDETRISYTKWSQKKEKQI